LLDPPVDYLIVLYALLSPLPSTCPSVRPLVRPSVYVSTLLNVKQAGKPKDRPLAIGWPDCVSGLRLPVNLATFAGSVVLSIASEAVFIATNPTQLE